MKRLVLLLMLCLLTCSVFSACGNTEPEITTAVVTEDFAETTGETAKETTAATTAKSTISETSAPMTSAETEATTEVTLSSGEIAHQERIEKNFKSVMENFTHVNFEFINDIPVGDNGIADIASGMQVRYSVDLEDELLEDIRSMFREPYFTVEENTEWYEDGYTAVVELMLLSGLTHEDDVFSFYFRYIPGDSAENSELLHLCYTVVGSKTYVYRMNKEAVSFIDDKFDGLYVRSADTRAVERIPEDQRTEASDNLVSAELTEEEKSQQAAINDTVAIRISVTNFLYSWEDGIREHISDCTCVYDITDEKIISEIVSELDKSNMIKYDKFLGFGRGGPWAYNITFVSENGEETTYFFNRDYEDVYDTGVYDMCIAYAGSNGYNYGLTERTVQFLDNLFDNLDFKSVTTR